MKNFRNIFVLIAMCIAVAFSASAQSTAEMANMLVSEMAKAMNSPELQKELTGDGSISKFTATANGDTLVLDATLGEKSVNFNDMSDGEKKALTDQFSSMLTNGIVQGGGTEVVDMLKMLGVKFKITFHDQYGNKISKLVTL